MSDSARAIRKFNEGYKGSPHDVMGPGLRKAVDAFDEAYGEGRRTEEMDFQRPNDRGLAPEGRQDPERTATFRASEGEEGGRGIRLRCAKCAAVNEVSHEQLGEAGYTYGGTEDLGMDDGDDDGDVDPADTDDTGSGN